MSSVSSFEPIGRILSYNLTQAMVIAKDILINISIY